MYPVRTRPMGEGPTREQELNAQRLRLAAEAEMEKRTAAARLEEAKKAEATKTADSSSSTWWLVGGAVVVAGVFMYFQSRKRR